MTGGENAPPAVLFKDTPSVTAATAPLLTAFHCNSTLNVTGEWVPYTLTDPATVALDQS